MKLLFTCCIILLFKGSIHAQNQNHELILNQIISAYNQKKIETKTITLKPESEYFLKCLNIYWQNYPTITGKITDSINDLCANILQITNRPSAERLYALSWLGVDAYLNGSKFKALGYFYKFSEDLKKIESDGNSTEVALFYRSLLSFYSSKFSLTKSEDKVLTESVKNLESLTQGKTTAVSPEAGIWLIHLYLNHFNDLQNASLTALRLSTTFSDNQYFNSQWVICNILQENLNKKLNNLKVYPEVDDLFKAAKLIQNGESYKALRLLGITYGKCITPDYKYKECKAICLLLQSVALRNLGQTEEAKRKLNESLKILPLPVTYNTYFE